MTIPNFLPTIFNKIAKKLTIKQYKDEKPCIC